MAIVLIFLLLFVTLQLYFKWKECQKQCQKLREENEILEGFRYTANNKIKRMMMFLKDNRKRLLDEGNLVAVTAIKQSYDMLFKVWKEYENLETK